MLSPGLIENPCRTFLLKQHVYDGSSLSTVSFFFDSSGSFKFFYNLEKFVKKLLAVSKSLQYSKLRYFGVRTFSVGFAVERWNSCPARCCQSGCLRMIKCAEACDELLDDQEEPIRCTAAFLM